jgi:hypothetical protein
MLYENYSKKLLSILVLVVSLISLPTQAQVLFEGYSKILVGDKPAGYAIQRYEFDQKTKTFSSTYYLKTGALGNNVTESLKAKSNQAFQPLSYQYTSKVGDQIKVIDATFKGQKMTAVVKVGTETVRVQKDLPKGTFLSTFLGYLMLNNGIAAGKKFAYSAIAEEDAEIFPGEAFVKNTEKQKGLDVFVILNTFKDTKFISYVTAKGDPIMTKSPLQKISTELTATALESTQGFDVNTQNLKLLFGSVPVGTVHSLKMAANVSPLTTDTTAVPGKKDGVPAGKGIQIKGSPAPGGK